MNLIFKSLFIYLFKLKVWTDHLHPSHLLLLERKCTVGRLIGEKGSLPSGWKFWPPTAPAAAAAAAERRRLSSGWAAVRRPPVSIELFAGREREFRRRRRRLPLSLGPAGAVGKSPPTRSSSGSFAPFLRVRPIPKFCFQDENGESNLLHSRRFLLTFCHQKGEEIIFPKHFCLFKKKICYLPILFLFVSSHAGKKKKQDREKENHWEKLRWIRYSRSFLKPILSKKMHKYWVILP